VRSGWDGAGPGRFGAAALAGIQKASEHAATLAPSIVKARDALRRGDRSASQSILERAASGLPRSVEHEASAHTSAPKIEFTSDFVWDGKVWVPKDPERANWKVWEGFIRDIVKLTGARFDPSNIGVMLDAITRWHAVAHAK
jgi:hypothetical protein